MECVGACVCVCVLIKRFQGDLKQKSIHDIEQNPLVAQLS